MEDLQGRLLTEKRKVWKNVDNTLPFVYVGNIYSYFQPKKLIVKGYNFS